MINKYVQILHSLLFIVTITGVGLWSVISKPIEFKQAHLVQLLNGEYARTLEEDYDDKLIIKELGVNLWAAVEYTLFNEGKAGLVVGKDGWLFTSEEFSVTENSEQALRKNIELIKWVNKEFTKQNITLLVVPVPAKARVYSDKVISAEPDTVHQKSYDSLLTVKHSAVHVADSLMAMQHDKAQAEQFLRTDTHWTPAGASVVAAETARYIKKYTGLNFSNKTYITELTEQRALSGDLLNYLPLSPWFDVLLPETDQLAVYETIADAEGGLDDLFGDTSESVALVGTSYSANPNWNFVGALKQALSTDIINYAQEGHGPIEPMMNFLEKYKTEMPDLELVIWEIPERYLSVSYQAAYAQRAKRQLDSSLIAKESTQKIWSM